jgi:hypothetical protein
MKDRKANQRKLIKAAEKAGGSLEHVDIPGWETSESAAEWVRSLRRADNERLERVFAKSRAIRQENEGSDRRDVPEAVEAAREEEPAE